MSVSSAWTAEIVGEVTAALEVILDKKLQGLDSKLAGLQSNMTQLTQDMAGFQQRTGALEDQVTAMEQRYGKLLKTVETQAEKIEDLENRSRRNNLRFVGLPEDIGERELRPFLEKWLVKELKLQSEMGPLIIERAHRVGPMRQSAARPPLLRAAVNFTLFIKNSIAFPRSHVFRRNLVETITSNTLKSCIYHKTKAPLCPVFRLGYIVNESGQQFDKIAYKGGTVGIRINWDCDLDWPVRFCIPVYTFHALDDAKSNISQGFNFRFAKYYIENGIRKRTLYKVFGIRFDIMITGKGGQFDIIPTMTMIGSGVGIFGVATVICDLLLLHILPKRKYYKKKKFKNAKKNSQKDPTTVPGDMEASQREECPPSPDEMTLANATSHEPSEKSMEQFPHRRSTLTFPPRRSALTSIMGWFMEMVSSVTEKQMKNLSPLLITSRRITQYKNLSPAKLHKVR
ncbi:P2X purinoceptor 5-like [Microcaecilia unicolor]|uniref:P2X purinoceptor n=1 Tax=Microcaecilia unicolor TaxID=1415580 RepID=A0A6P7ZVX1_9AMPH|nr:P2X purinoceptor 5-like [Microcaecilia unicolor]